MKKILFIVLLTCACFKLQAQVNYVLNPSFETDTACPYTVDQIFFSVYWQTIDSVYEPDSAGFYGTCGPELCSACATGSGPSVPMWTTYYQYPRTGNAMVHFKSFCDNNASPIQRDYPQGHLYKPLIAGKSYCVTYFVNLAEGSGYATNNINAYLDDGSVDTIGYYCGMPHTEIISQIIDDSIISDTMNWVKIQGSFVADGSERFITIGNFKDKSHTSYSAVTYPSGAGNEFGLYLLDDVSVIESDNIPFAGNDTAIHTGDSVFLGPHEIALPYTWYVVGNTAPIDSGGGMWVHPDSTTTYMLEQNRCGMLTYDTVKVTVGSVNVENVGSVEDVKVWPNPVRKNLSLELRSSPGGHPEGEGTAVRLYDVVGQCVYAGVMKSNKETIDVSQLRAGTYLLEMIAGDWSRKNVTLIKE